MCGIVGIVEQGSEEMHSRVERMCGAIHHRGPDDGGVSTPLPHVGLGMRRLSIIDVMGGHQPLTNEAGDITVVFNGEIYNHHTLRSTLAGQGHVFKTASDTECLVHLYEEHGERMVDHLNGMFAFAIWDGPNERLFLARDRLGIKPIYYWPTSTGVGFASELRSYLANAQQEPKLSSTAMGLYLMLGYVPDPHAVFEGVAKLPPGHTLRWDKESGITLKRYWQPPPQSAPDATEAELVEQLRDLLVAGITSRMESEVPLGAFLSGGLDSSTVVAVMARHSNRPVKTFSIGFEEAAYNEAPAAAAVADALGTDHTELIVRPDVDNLVADVVGAFDEPFADSSAIPTFLVSQLAASEVTVALSGDGGDELFAGYTRYGKALAQGGLPSFLGRRLAPLVRLAPHGLRGRNRMLDWCRSFPGRYAGTVATSGRIDEGGIIRRDLTPPTPSLETLLQGAFAEGAGRDRLNQLTTVDLLTYLPGDILTKVDRCSMAVSLEARVPLLDHHLAEFAIALPARFKRQGNEGKWLFRKVIRELIPTSVLARPKSGFSIPLAEWFRGPLRHRLDGLLDPHAQVFQFADAPATSRLVQEHLRGRRDQSQLLWRVLVLQLWLKALTDGTLQRPSSFLAGTR